MPLYKNTASQKIPVYAYDTSADGPKTGDAAQITAQISKDGAATAATDDTNPTELDATDAPGVYIFDMTQAETNANMIVLSAVSSTSNIKIEPYMGFTGEAMRGTDSAATSSALSTHDGKLDTAQADLDTITGADGTTLATSQGNYAPNKVVPDAAGVAPTAAENFTAVLTTALTESYAADGAAPTLAQAIFLVQQSLHEFAISTTTRTVKKLDGSTTAATFTFDDATSPTSSTRAT